MGRPDAYHLLSIRDKQAASLATQREPAIPCPTGCGVQTTPADLLAHVAERCAGPPATSPASIWVSWRDALATGVPPRTLTRWAQRGYVRRRGGRGDGEYLLRDLAIRVVQRRTYRR